jgi:CheY-like chemotaxis protein
MPDTASASRGKPLATILVIDDDDAVRDFLVEAIEEAGHTVIAADGGVVGLSKFAEKHPDMVLTDIIMPDRDGLEVISEIRSADPNASWLGEQFVELGSAGRKISLTLIHNEKAGDADHGRAWLVELLKGAGFEVGYVPYDPSQIDAALEQPAEIIAVASTGDAKTQTRDCRSKTAR